MSPKLVMVSLISAVLLLSIIAMGHTRPQDNIVSWFEADMDNDSKNELLVITRSHPDMVLETGEAYGDYIRQYSEFRIVNNRPVIKGKANYEFDLSDIKPLKIQAGDINGDGVMELSVCTYKTTKFHPVMAKRPFFYDLSDGSLEPVWLGSRLARPFDQYILYDLDRDGLDEIVSIEWTERGNRLFAAYDWKGFGFEVKAVSEEIEGESAFINNVNGRGERILVSIAGDTYELQLDQGGIGFTRE